MRAALLACLALVPACRWDWNALAGDDDGGPFDARIDAPIDAPFDGIVDDRVYDVCLEGLPIRLENTCTGFVCGIDADCCDVAWDHQCTQLADRLCSAQCSGMAISGTATGITSMRTASVGALAISVPSTREVWSIAQADFDRDGDLDLAYGDEAGWGVLRNDGDLANLVSAGSDDTVFDVDATFNDRHVAWADWDGDDDLDLAIAGEDGVYLVRQTGGEFATVTPALQSGQLVAQLDWGDIDGDGDLDLVHGSHDNEPRVTLLRNDGSGNFTPLLQDAAILGDGGLRLCNVVGDARPDLVTAGQSASAGTFVRVYEATGGAFSTTPALAVDVGYVIEAHCGDLDGDLDLDIAVNYWDTPYKVRVFTNAGGTFDGGTLFPTNGIGQTASMDIGDVDGDHKLDLVVSTNVQTVRTLLNTTPGADDPISFDDPIDLAGMAPPEWLAVDLAPLPP